MIKDCIEDQMFVIHSLAHSRAQHHIKGGQPPVFNNHHSHCPTVEDVATLSDIFYGKPQPVIKHGSLQLHP